MALNSLYVLMCR